MGRVYELTALIVFLAMSAVILIGAYNTPHIDICIVALLAITILWHVYKQITRRKRND
jgi:4-amino-4-deoxy-L-arabinose transferase-like glycosyltransferase